MCRMLFILMRKENQYEKSKKGTLMATAFSNGIYPSARWNHGNRHVSHPTRKLWRDKRSGATGGD